MAAPYVLSGIMYDMDTALVYMSEPLATKYSSDVEQYTLQILTTSGLLTTSAVYMDEGSSLVYVQTDEGFTEEGTYRVTVSGVINETKEEIDYEQNTADFSVTIDTLDLTLASPTGGEDYLNGQYKPITWYLTIT